MTSSRIKASFIFDLDTEDPIVIDVPETSSGKVAWGMDATGSASYGPSRDHGLMHITDPEGVFDPARRASGTTLTPRGRSLSKGEAAGWRLGVILSHRDSRNKTAYLWSGFAQLEEASRFDISEVRLQASIGRQLANKTALSFTNNENSLYRQLAGEFKDALRLQQEPIMQVGDLVGPLEIDKFEGTGGALLKQMGLYARGIAGINLVGQPVVIARDQIQENVNAFDPITIAPNATVDLRGEIAGNTVEIRGVSGIEITPSSAVRLGAVASSGTNVWWLLTNGVRMRANAINPITREFVRYPGGNIAGNRITIYLQEASTNLRDFRDVLFAVGGPFASTSRFIPTGEENLHVILAESNGAVSKYIGPTTSRIGTIKSGALDIAWHADVLYVLYGDRIETYATDRLGNLGANSVLFSLAPNVITTGYLSATSRGIDVYDKDNNILRWYRYDSTIAYSRNMGNIFSADNISGIGSVVDTITFMERRNANRINVVTLDLNIQIATNPPIKTVSTAPRWRIHDPIITKPFLAEPQLGLSISDLQVGTLITASNTEGVLDIKVATDYPRSSENLSKWKVGPEWSSLATEWLADLNSNPVEFVFFKLRVSIWPPDWVEAANRRLDIGTRVVLRDGEGNNYTGMICGRSLEWEGPIVSLGFAIWLADVELLDTNELEYKFNKLTYKGKTLTWK